MSLNRRRAVTAAWGAAVLLLVVPPATAQAPPLSFEALVDGDIPAWELSDRLDACLGEIEEKEEARASAERARRERIRERLVAAAAARAAEILEQLARDPHGAVAPEQREELAAELTAMFPTSEEIRLETCGVRHERALRRLVLADELERCYRGAFDDLGVGHLAPTADDAVAGVRAAAIRAFACSREIQPLATEVALPPGATVVLVAATVCLDADLPRPADGDPYAVTPGPVPAEILGLLRAAAGDPTSLADAQEAIWSRTPATPGGAPRGAGSHGAVSTGGVSSSRSRALADAVADGTIDLTAIVHDGFTSTDLVLSNRTGGPVTVNLTGARLQPKGGGGESQSLGVAGQDPGQPPRAPSLESREKRLERALQHARERLQNAIERVRNGDHSPEALRELLEALREAEALGLDGDEAGEALQNEGFDALVDGWNERAEESYKVWEHDPTDANRAQALRDFKAVEQVGGPPDASSDDYDRMLADLAGE
jgi:hypothetical protein